MSPGPVYHYFPSKQAFFVATLEQQAGELAARVQVDPSLPAAEQLSLALDTFLEWVEEHAEGYGKLLEHRDLEREALRDLLLGTLLGAVLAAGGDPPT